MHGLVSVMVLGCRLDLTFLEVFSNLPDSGIFHFAIMGQHGPRQY